MRRSLRLAGLLLVACATTSPGPPAPTPTPISTPAPAPTPTTEAERPVATEPAPAPASSIEQTLAELDRYAEEAAGCGELAPPSFDAEAMVAAQLNESSEDRVALRESMEAIIAARLACRRAGD